MPFDLYRVRCILLLICLVCCAASQAQLPETGSQPAIPNPLVDSTMSPGKTLLFDLEARFARAVAARGGAAFQDWFAPDGVLLGNGAAPVVGLVAIARFVHWSPASYQLAWTPTDAVISPAGDMGYTWGHYEGRSKDLQGNPVTTSGRYVSVWRRQPDGEWKITLDASANEPPSAGDCCRLPAPGK